MVITYMRWDISFDELAAVLEIRMGNRDNFEIFIHIFPLKNIFVPIIRTVSVETVLMRGHNICFS